MYCKVEGDDVVDLGLQAGRDRRMVDMSHLNAGMDRQPLPGIPLFSQRQCIAYLVNTTPTQDAFVFTNIMGLGD